MYIYDGKHGSKAKKDLMGGKVANLRAIAFHCLSLFFFQAEDGIRDLTVTGVQTCALPISVRLLPLLLLGTLAIGADSPPRFESSVLPVFKAKCLACHSSSAKQGGLSLETQIGRASCRERV